MLFIVTAGGGGWSEWVVGNCSKTCGIGIRVDQRYCTASDHEECCPGSGLRQMNCSTAECPGMSVES